jgi:tRNA (guanine26-N2/guanine27-N2)-dimethyltransferase
MIIKGITPQIVLECPFCEDKLKIAGPLWCDKIEDVDFIKEMLQIMETTQINQENKAIKLLNFVYDESNAPATFYDLHKVYKNLKISAPQLKDVIDSLINNGFFASRTHFKPTGIKTDASVEEIKLIILNLI